MPNFIQEAAVAANRFRTDRALRLTLQRLLPHNVFRAATPALDRMGERAVRELPALAARAEREPPRHVPFDPWGSRVDSIETSAAFDRLVAIGQAEGLVALPYEGRFGAYGRIVQAGLMNLFDPVSAVASCPLTMSDGAAWLLKRHDPDLAARYLPRLTARTAAMTSGQWMTETAGGSDVGRTATIATPQPDGTFRLRGTKFFTSATSADIALVLARPEGAPDGSDGLSLFLLELRRPDGSWNDIEVRRLKDKMGTRALPTAELDLRGSIAVPVGGLGRGVAKIASLLNIARLWAAMAGPAAVGHLLGLARDYADRREVFGAKLRDNRVHTAWLAQLTAEYEAMLALCFETAAAVGQAEHGGNAGMARLLTPLAKLACARDGIDTASQLIESFGGAGYMEDTGLPAVFRNVHVHTIWEGTTNVLAHDVMRALGKQEIAREWLADMAGRLRGVTHGELDPVLPRIDLAIETLRPLILEPDPAEARRIAQGMARVTQATLLAEAAQWRIATQDDRSALIAVELITRMPMVAERSCDMELEALAYGVPAEQTPQREIA